MSFFGSLSSVALRNTAVGVLCCVAIGTPIGIVFGGGNNKFKHPLDSGFSLQKAGEAGNTNWDFQFNNTVDLESWKDKEVKKFEDVKMAFGDYVLQEKDLLISPEQDGKYYLAKWNGRQWELPNGTKKTVFNRWDVHNKGFKHINLNWTKPSWLLPLSRIEVGSCTFTKIDVSQSNEDWKIKISCSKYSGKNVAWNFATTTTLSKSDFKNFFS